MHSFLVPYSTLDGKTLGRRSSIIKTLRLDFHGAICCGAYFSILSKTTLRWNAHGKKNVSLSVKRRFLFKLSDTFESTLDHRLTILQCQNLSIFWKTSSACSITIKGFCLRLFLIDIVSLHSRHELCTKCSDWGHSRSHLLLLYYLLFNGSSGTRSCPKVLWGKQE